MEKISSRFLELITSARKSLSAGDLASSAEFANLLLKEFPKSEEGWLVLASVSKPDEALDHLGNALRVNPGSRAVRQAIQLIAHKVIDGNQAIIAAQESCPFEHTQPIKLHEVNADNFGFIEELDGQDNYNSETDKFLL